MEGMSLSDVPLPAGAGADPADEIGRIFALQKAREPSVRQSGAEERLAKLARLMTAIEARARQVSAAIVHDLNKPSEDILHDYGAPLFEMRAVETQLAEWMKPDAIQPVVGVRGARAEIRKEPKGKVLIFGAWNYPFALTMQPLVGAIAAGNCCMVKPAELAPATSAEIARIVASAFDEDEVAVIEGGPDVAEALLECPFDHIFYTGSSRIGRKVMAAAAGHLASVTLELGGKSPVIVDATADASRAGRRVAEIKFKNAGQICVTADHAWVATDRRDAFVAAAAAQIEDRYYESGAFRRERMAPVISDHHAARLRHLIGEACRRGATIARGGGGEGRWLEPTILVDVPAEAEIMQEEIFGPVLPVLAYDDIADVKRYLARRGPPLALYLFSEDRDFVRQAITDIPSGGVTVNDLTLHAADPQLPFGGVGSSGMGAYHGRHTFEAFSHRRSVFYQAVEAA